MTASARNHSTAIGVLAAVALLTSACSSASTTASHSATTTATPSGGAAASRAGSSSAGGNSPAASNAVIGTAGVAHASAAPTAGGDPLGAIHAATGDPVVFGVLNLESGPVTFPEVVQAEQAAVAYVNAYRGGIGGHPIRLVTCATDGQPSTSQRCANQILDQKPVAILGGADTGSPGAIPVWTRANLAYLGGVPFTPLEQNYVNSVLFSSVSAANAAGSVYAATTLKARSAAVIYTSDTQGTAIAQNDIIATLKNAGVDAITQVPIPPTSSDVSSAVATAVGAHPDMIYIDAPAACPNIMSSLKQLGNTAKVFGIDPCTSPKAIAGSNGGADGLFFVSPTLDPGAGTADTTLFLAALKKYATGEVNLDAPAAIGFQTVMNVQATLAKFSKADLTTAKIVAAFKAGTDVPNFMGHPYTCNGTQVAKATAICNGYQQVRQVKGTSIVPVSTGFITAGAFYQG